jgi:hypothetical protein
MSVFPLCAVAFRRALPPLRAAKKQSKRYLGKGTTSSRAVSLKAGSTLAAAVPGLIVGTFFRGWTKSSTTRAHMSKYKIAVCFPLLVSVVAGMSYAQSLGDVARQQRQKQQAKDLHATRKVVTNEEIPESPDASPSSSTDSDSPRESSSLPSTTGKRTADQWKSDIQAQKARIAAMQSQVDKLNDSVHFVEANRYYNGVQYNQYQLKKQQEAQRMQKQLEGEKRTLQNMQESARKSDFGSAVYDP